MSEAKYSRCVGMSEQRTRSVAASEAGSPQTKNIFKVF
jgi:hypothetical protein